MVSIYINYRLGLALQRIALHEKDFTLPDH